MLYCAGAGPVQAGQDSRDVQQAAPGINHYIIVRMYSTLKRVCQEIFDLYFFMIGTHLGPQKN